MGAGRQAARASNFTWVRCSASAVLGKPGFTVLLGVGACDLAGDGRGRAGVSVQIL